MQKSARCHACRKEVTEAPRVCPHCGAPNPTLKYPATGKIVVILSVVIATAIAMDLLHDRSATSTSNYTRGRSYGIAKRGVACLTAEALAKAAQTGAAGADEARHLGCLLLLPDKEWHVEVLDTNGSALKVRLFAPDPDLKDFTGWTEPDTINPEPEE